MRIFAYVFSFTGKEYLGLYEGPDKLLHVHTVIAEKTGGGKRGGYDYAQPACRLPAQHPAQAQVYARCCQHRSQGTEKLPCRQAEKYALLVLSYFFWYFDFYLIHLYPYKNLTSFILCGIILVDSSYMIQELMPAKCVSR